MSSCTASIVSIIRLLKHFNKTNAQKFKNLLMKELECSDETQFMCKILSILSKSLTNESLITLKTEAIKLAEQQPSQTNTEISVYKQIQQQYKDGLSNLSSDIIDYLGTFLNKKQSVEFGYLNKQLYIETQKQSYLLKRNKDKAFDINDYTVDRFFWQQTNAFSYSLPKSLFVNVMGDKQFDYPSSLLQSSKWYKNAFNVLNRFSCCDFNYLAGIPIENFFNQNGRYKYCEYSGRLKQIQKFECMLKHETIRPDTYKSEKMRSSVTKFCDKFSNYFTHDCQNKFENIRRVKELIISEKQETQHAANKFETDQGMRKDILLTVGPICEKITIRDTQIDIDDTNEMKNIFHSNLKTFEFTDKSKITFPTAADIDPNKVNTLGSSFELSIMINCRSNYDTYYSRMIQFIEETRMIGLQSKMKCIKMSISSYQQKYNLSQLLCCIFNLNQQNDDSATDGKRAIENVGTCTSKNLRIKIANHVRNLHQFISILQILSEYRSRILDSLVNNFDTISFSLQPAHAAEKVSVDNEICRRILLYQRDTEYSIDRKEIVLDNCDLSEKQLGVFYQNTVQWLKMIKKTYGDSKLHEEYNLHLTLKKNECT